MYIICKNSVPESYAIDYATVEQYIARLKDMYTLTGVNSRVIGKFYIVKEPSNDSVYTIELIDNTIEVSHGYIWNGSVVVSESTLYTVYNITNELHQVTNTSYNTVIDELKSKFIDRDVNTVPLNYEPLVPTNSLSELRMLLDTAIMSRRTRINGGTDENYDNDMYVQIPNRVNSDTADSDTDSDTDSEFERWYVNRNTVSIQLF